MNYDEYVREGHIHYHTFAGTVAAILRAAIDDGGVDFHLQQISHRAKSNASLLRKLTERGLLESQAIEAELKDLAGCRLVFYTNTDIDRFLNSRLIFDNFKIDFDGSKIHHAVGKDRSAEDLYFAIHYLVSLKDERLALPEYRKFRDLRCEIQIQTILNHAWAETTHDILYHRPDMKGFGTKQFAAIKERLTKIMNKYLLPAGYEFQTVQHDFARLQQGKELFDRNTIEALATATNNDDRYEHLRRLKEDLLPFYDDVAAIAPDLKRAVVAAIKHARVEPPRETETLLGSMPSHTLEHIVDAGLEIIETIRYVDIEETFRVLCDLHATATGDHERQRIVQAIERLARHDTNVWRQVGCGVQKVLQEAITTLSSVDRLILRPVVLAVAGKILNPEVSGSTWHFQSVSLHRGSVVPSESFAAVRNRVLDLLFQMYGEGETEQDKREVLHALHEATSFSTGGPALSAMLLAETLRIVEFFASRADSEQFELLQTIEHHYLWLYRRGRELARSQREDHAALTQAAKAVVAGIEHFRERANGREEFVIFKTLVGYESVFPLEWDGDAMNIEAREAYRNERITAYVSAVKEDTAVQWYERIRRCASVKSNDMATFPSFFEFLKQLARCSPPIVFAYLDKEDDVLTPFLPAVLQGLSESEQPAPTRDLIKRWIAGSRHLAAIARYLRLTKGGSSDLIRDIGVKALEAKDRISVIETIAAIVANKAFDLVDPVVMPGIRLFTSLEDTAWVEAIWFMPEVEDFLSNFTEDQCETVLGNLLLTARIRHPEEQILCSIATNFPRAVWRFFKTRLDQENNADASDKYEAIPYELHDLVKPLAADAPAAVDTVRGWYDTDEELFQFRGAKVLHNVFPSFSRELEAKLISVTHEATDTAINFVLAVLEAYDGETFLQGVCKEIVAVLPADDSRLGDVELILQSTGVVTGQFGFVETYQGKRDEIAPWLSDARPQVRAFAEKYRRTLDRSIAAEQRRSEADYEIRRRGWPDEDQEST